MALRSGYKGFKKLLPGLKLLRPGTLGIDNDVLIPELNKIFFPRSEQAVLGAKNLGEIILGYYIQEASEGYFKLTADTNAITYIAKVEQNTEYRCKKLASGDRFAITGFVNYPSKTTATNEASKLFDDATATEKVVNSGTYNYLGFTVNRTAEVAESSIKGMIYLASDTDSTYAPYAMTNKELTGSVQTYKTTINAIITAATGAADFAAFKAAMEAITPVTRSLSREASPEDVHEEVIEEEKPVTKKTTKKTVKEGE